MDAYVLGSHDGALPTHLLAAGEPGNRVRVMAQLDGTDHNAFYAIEAPDQAAVTDHVSAITGTGTQAAKQFVAQTGNEVSALVLPGLVHPSHMPPWLVYVFLVLHGGGDGGGIQAASDVLGSDGVAVAEDQDGNAIIELGANDTESLERATAALRDAYGDSLSDAYAVTGDGLVRA